MHEVTRSKKFLSLAANIALLSLLPLLWLQACASTEVLDQVLDNEGTFGNDHRRCGTGRGDTDDWRFPQSVYFLELWRCKSRLLVSVEDDEFIGNTELFKKP